MYHCCRCFAVQIVHSGKISKNNLSLFLERIYQSYKWSQEGKFQRRWSWHATKGKPGAGARDGVRADSRNIEKMIHRLLLEANSA